MVIIIHQYASLEFNEIFDFQNILIWNEIPTSLRDKSRSMFESELHNILLKMLRTHDGYLNISHIGQAIKLA